MSSNSQSLLPLWLVEKLVRNAFGAGVRILKVTEVAERMFSAVYAIKSIDAISGFDEVILKIGMRPWKEILTYEKGMMQTELAVCRLLTQKAVPIPKVLYSDFSHTIVDCDYFFMEKPQGDTWEKLSAEMSFENRLQFEYELGRCAAQIHSIKGPYFGYIMEDAACQFKTWREAFRSFIDNIIADGKREGADLPYEKVMETLAPYWGLLDEIEEPSLVNYDMWGKNILLAKKDGMYAINGIMGHERSFYGDPVAEFIFIGMACGGVEKALAFQKGYSEITGEPFVFTKNDRLRFCMYNVYMGLLMGVGIERYGDDGGKRFNEFCCLAINRALGTLIQIGAE